MSRVIYTNENDCQDCYKCVRKCPVKSISMIDNHASIDEERCIMCGTCIAVCPTGAQKYRNDEVKVKTVLQSHQKVVMAVAPAFAGELDFSPSVLIEIAKQLGFYGVSETALGAQIVTYFQRKLLAELDTPTFSTACPTFVQLVMKYYPDLKKNLSPLLSPLLSQCVMLKKIYGDDVSIVFVGPCLAKKVESDIHPELLDAALTFDEFRSMIKSAGLDIEQIKSADRGSNTFIPIHSNGGALYPLDGGMVETIKDLMPSSVADTDFFHYAGTKIIRPMLEEEDFQDNGNIFCEFLACDGGCINGSGVFDKKPILTKKLKISKYFKSLESYSESEFIERYAPESVMTEYEFCPPVELQEFTEEEKKTIWHKLDKFTKADFIDCGACGYDTCDKFAVACLENRAELEMCATSMKKKAQTKVQSFMKATPLAFCVVDSKMNIVECNAKFVELSVDIDINVTDKMIQQVIGGNIEKFFPVSNLLEQSLKNSSKESTLIHKDTRIFNVMAFPFENNRLVGMIVQDITKPSMKRDVVVSKSQEVIKNNLLTVQKIAFLLGETAAETEITLNEIIDAYKTSEDK